MQIVSLPCDRVIWILILHLRREQLSLYFYRRCVSCNHGALRYSVSSLSFCSESHSESQTFVSNVSSEIPFLFNRKNYVLSLNNTGGSFPTSARPARFHYLQNDKIEIDWLLSLSVTSAVRDNPIRVKLNGICGLRCTGYLRKMSTCENRRLRICILKCSTPCSDRIKTQTRFDIWITNAGRRRDIYAKETKVPCARAKTDVYRLTY